MENKAIPLTKLLLSEKYNYFFIKTHYCVDMQYSILNELINVF